MRKKKGFLGRALLSSLMWSLWGYQLELLSQPWTQTAEGGWGGWEERSIRIVSSNTDNFAAIRRDTTRGHLNKPSIQCLQCKLT